MSMLYTLDELADVERGTKVRVHGCIAALKPHSRAPESLVLVSSWPNSQPSSLSTTEYNGSIHIGGTGTATEFNTSIHSSGIGTSSAAAATKSVRQDHTHRTRSVTIQVDVSLVRNSGTSTSNNGSSSRLLVDREQWEVGSWVNVIGYVSSHRLRKKTTTTTTTNTNTNTNTTTSARTTGAIEAELEGKHNEDNDDEGNDESDNESDDDDDDGDEQQQQQKVKQSTMHPGSMNVHVRVYIQALVMWLAVGQTLGMHRVYEDAIHERRKGMEALEAAREVHKALSLQRPFLPSSASRP